MAVDVGILDEYSVQVQGNNPLRSAHVVPLTKQIPWMPKVSSNSEGVHGFASELFNVDDDLVVDGEIMVEVLCEVDE